MSDMENELAAAVEAALPKASGSLHVVKGGDLTSVEYLEKIERARVQLREKLRRERLAIVDAHERMLADIDATHAESRRRLEAETRQRLRDNDDLAARMGA